MENYLRVQAVEVMKKNIQLVKKRDFSGIKKNLKSLEKKMNTNALKSEKIDMLKQDLQKMEEQCEAHDHVNAERYYVEAERAHSRQKNYAYQN